MNTDYNISEVNPIVKREVAYVLGFIWADGCVYVRPNKSSRQTQICIVSEDMKKIKPILNKVFKWSYSNFIPKNKKWKKKTTAIIYRRGICNFLIENDYTSKINSADKILSKIPQELQVYWFRGLVDGDGCFYVNKNNRAAHFEIYSEYNQNWNFVELLLNKLNIKYSIYRRLRKKGSSSGIRITNVEDVIKFGDWLYLDKNFMGLKRKYKKYLKIKMKLFPIMRKRKTKFKGVYFRKGVNHWFVSPIINGKIKRVGGFTSDVEAHNYLKNIPNFSGKRANWSGII